MCVLSARYINMQFISVVHDVVYVVLYIVNYMVILYTAISVYMILKKFITYKNVSLCLIDKFNVECTDRKYYINSNIISIKKLILHICVIVH